MLKIIIPRQELFDENTCEFKYTKEYELQLEHSLISVAKWESIWCKPFLSTEKKTQEETISYMKCMTLTQNVPEEAYKYVPDDVINAVNKYIDSKMTATWFSDKANKGNPGGTGEAVTAELIYYWMIDNSIPFECQKWHLNRLLTLIRVCNVKRSGGKKMSQKEILQQNKALNEARRAKKH